jgi:rubrerythrin
MSKIILQYTGEKGGSEPPYFCPQCKAKFDININFDNNQNKLFCPICEVKDKTPSN